MRFRLLVCLFSLFLGIGTVDLFRSIVKVVSPTWGEHLFDTVRPIETKAVEVLLIDKERDADTGAFPSLDDAFDAWYSVKGSKGLKDVNLILISREGSELVGGVFTNFETEDSGFIEMRWGKLDGNHVSFRTKRIRGFDFEFQGEFFKNRPVGEDGEIILRGTISQFRNKKLVARTTGDFAYFEPQCSH